jgi:hypothetical protein
VRKKKIRGRKKKNSERKKKNLMRKPFGKNQYGVIVRFGKVLAIMCNGYLTGIVREI